MPPPRQLWRSLHLPVLMRLLLMLASLIVGPGELPEDNEFTYWSFRKFFNHLIEMA